MNYFSYPGVIGVAACDENYAKTEKSNYGSDITVIAPGNRIRTASIGGDRNYNRWSGTSMAAPAVAAMLSIWVGYEGINDNAQRAADLLDANQLPNLLTGFPNPTVNKLVNSGLNQDPNLPYIGAPDTSAQGDLIPDARKYIPKLHEDTFLSSRDYEICHSRS